MKKYLKNTPNYIYILIFLLISMAPLCLAVVGQAAGTGSAANIEKRENKPFPSILTEGGVNESFDDECEGWLNQNIPYRAELLSTINTGLGSVLKVPTSNVVPGADGWIYSSETIDDYLGTNALSHDDIRNIAITLSLIQEKITADGGQFLFVPVPNKNNIYPEYMPNRYVRSEQNNLTMLMSELDRSSVDYVNLKKELLNARQNGSTPKLYYKKDTHWTVFGASVGYQSIMGELGRTPIVYDLNDYSSQYSRFSDLDKLLFPAGCRPDEEYVLNNTIDFDGFEFINPAGVTDTRAQLENFMSDKEDHDNNFTTKKRQPEDNSVLIMYRDSFARALLPFMIDTYNEATFVRTATPSLEGIDTSGDVVYEICERNLKNVIASAPYMFAPQREETGYIYKVYDSELNSCFASDEGYAYRVYGTTDPQMVGDDGRIYIRAYDGDGDTRLFEAFPILEKELLIQDYAAASEKGSQVSADTAECPVDFKQPVCKGFSLYIPKGIFSQDEIGLRIVSGNSESSEITILSLTSSDGDASESATASLNPYPDENADHQLNYRGVNIGIGDNMNALKQQLGDMAAPSEIVNSCLSGTDAFLYYYPGITIETDMDGSIYYISLMDNSYSDGKPLASTVKGITIGSDKMDIWSKLGNPLKENDKNCIYQTEHLNVTYSYKSGKVTAVILEDRKYSADDAFEEAEETDNGVSYESGNAYLYDDEHLMQTGWQLIDGEYYFFNRLTGERVTGETVDGIEIGPDGELNLTEYDKRKIETMIKAHDVMMQVTSPDDTMEEKRRKVFDWVLSFPYHRFRHIRDCYTEEGIEIIEANDIFDEGAGDCVSESAAVAFLFHEVGYENVYWVHDTGHSWVRCDDKLFDPLFAESRGFDANYDAPFTDYRRSMDHAMLIY